MLNMDEEKKLQSSLSNESAGGQEEDAEYAKTIKKRLPCSKRKTAIGIVIISLLILIVGGAFGLGTLMPLNHQQDAIKYILVTCPPDWIGYQGHCYKFSKEEKIWKESQNFCMSHNASLAKITKEEMDFVTNITRDHVFWIDLINEPNQPWKWRDGENATLKVLGDGGNCAYLNDDGTASSGRCTTEHRFICKKNNDFMRSQNVFNDHSKQQHDGFYAVG